MSLSTLSSTLDAEQTTQTTESRRSTVLLVDDDLAVLRSLTKLLILEDYDVIQAQDGLEAVQKFRNARIDLIILDLNMPKMSGWEALDRIQSIFCLIPVIIVTALPHQYERAAQSNVLALMEKPIDFELLLELSQVMIRETLPQRLQRAMQNEMETEYWPEK